MTLDEIGRRPNNFAAFLPRSGMALDEIGRWTVASARPDVGMPHVVPGHNLN
jgi:hypothetical protein